MQRMYDDNDDVSDRGSVGVPGYIPTETSTVKPHHENTQYEVAAQNRVDELMETMQKRVKMVEDKSVMMDTTSRRVAMEGDGIKRRLQEIEHDTHKTINEITSGLERSLRGVAESRREVEACKEWSQSYLASQLSQHEQVIKTTFGNEITTLSNRTKQIQESVSNVSTRFDSALKIMQESTRNQAIEAHEKQTMKMQVIEGAVGESLKKAEMLEQHFADSLEVAISRERSARERDVLERDRIMQQLSQSCSAAVEREIGSEIKKTSEFAETSIQRMDAIERLLKAEIRNRMDLSTNHDRLVDDVRKIERNTITSISQIETSLQDKYTDLSTQIAQQSTQQREALNALTEVQKKAMLTMQTTVQAEVQELRSFLTKKVDANSQALMELTQKVYQNSVKSDDNERVLAELRAQQDRDSKETRSMLARSENKVTEELSSMSASLQEFCSKQLQGSIKESLQREQSLKESCAADLKRAQDDLLVVKRNQEKDVQDLRKLVYDKNNDTQEEVMTNLDRLTTLIQKTDELSRLQLDKNHEIGIQISDTRQMVEDSSETLTRRLATLSTLEARHHEEQELRAREIAEVKTHLKQGLENTTDTLLKKHKELLDTERRTREEVLNEVAEVGRRTAKRCDECSERSQRLEDSLDDKERVLKRRIEDVVQRSSDEDDTVRKDIVSLKEFMETTRQTITEVNERELKIGNDVRKELISVADKISDAGEREQRTTESLKQAIAEVRRSGDGAKSDVDDLRREMAAQTDAALLEAEKRAKEEDARHKREKFLKEEIAAVAQACQTLSDKTTRDNAERAKEEGSAKLTEAAYKRDMQSLTTRTAELEALLDTATQESAARNADLRGYVEEQILQKLQRTEERLTKKTQSLETELERRRDLDHETKKEVTLMLASLNDVRVSLHDRYDSLDKKLDHVDRQNADTMLKSSKELTQQMSDLADNKDVIASLDTLQTRVDTLENGSAESSNVALQLNALKIDIVELKNELGERTVMRGELDVVARKLVAIDAEAKGAVSEREHLRTRVDELISSNQERVDSDAAWDDWKETVSNGITGAHMNAMTLQETQEACHRQFLYDDENTKRKMYILESDLQRVDLDIEAYEKLLESFHQKESDAMGRRLSAPET